MKAPICGGKNPKNRTSTHNYKKKEKWKWREKITIKPKNGKKNHGKKRWCTIHSEKDYCGVVISDQEFDCFSFSFSLEEKEYLYKLRDDVEVASISGGCNRTIFVVVIAFQL